jgi:hypothetical protein
MLFERKSLRAIGCERRTDLRSEQARQHDARVGQEEARNRGGQPLQRGQQDVGEHEFEWRTVAQAGRSKVRGMQDFDQTWHAIEAGICARNERSAAIDVARKHRTSEGLRGGDGEHAAPGTKVEHARP